MAALLSMGILGVLGLLFGVMLTIAAKAFNMESDTRIEAIREVLPGANCGGCGFAGCDAFAEALAKGTARPNGCAPGGTDTAAAIGKILGVAVQATEAKKACVLCQGTVDSAKPRYLYDGYQSCRVAASLSGGPKECRFACIGLGDCAKVCKFGAITIVDGISHIDERLCVSCGTCVLECPRSVIALSPRNAGALVRCRNTDPGKEARSACERACIACGRCKRACKSGAISVESGIAYIDQEKCVRCGACARVCPNKCITLSGEANAAMVRQAKEDEKASDLAALLNVDLDDDE